MSLPTPTHDPAGTAMARWSAKVLLITGGVALVGGALWYARAATVPLIVAALLSTQLIPLVAWAVGRGVPRGVAIGATLVGVVLAAAGLVWLFADALFGELGGVGQQIADGADEALAWLQSNNSWVADNEQAIRDFLKGILPAATRCGGGSRAGSAPGGATAWPRPAPPPGTPRAATSAASRSWR